MNGWWWWRWMVTGPASPFLPGWQLSTTTSPTCCSSTQPNPPQPRLPLSPRRRLSISSIFSAGDISPIRRSTPKVEPCSVANNPFQPPLPPLSLRRRFVSWKLLVFPLCTTCQLKTSSPFTLLLFFFRILPCFRFLSLDPGAGRRIFSSPSSLQTKAPFPVLIIS